MYPDGPSVLSYLRVKPFADPFWALGIVLYRTRAYTATGDPARQPIASVNHATVGQWKVRFNLREEATAPSHFPSSCIIYVCPQPTSAKVQCGSSSYTGYE